MGACGVSSFGCGFRVFSSNDGPTANTPDFPAIVIQDFVVYCVGVVALLYTLPSLGHMHGIRQVLSTPVSDAEARDLESALVPFFWG